MQGGKTILGCLALGVVMLPVAHGQLSPPDVIGSYPLDPIPRTIEALGKIKCPKVDLVRYEGGAVKYKGALTVNGAFKNRLERFEVVVQLTAREVYGRAPRRIEHMGSYKCRRIRRYPDLLSEHGLGNALDVSGFDFGPLPRGDVLPDGVPLRLRRPFLVTVLDHWNARGKLGALHSRFLRMLASRLIDRQDIFRVLLGPAWPGHHNHFHFDMSNYHLVAIFEGETRYVF